MSTKSGLLWKISSVVASLAIAVTLFSPAPVRAAGDTVQTITFGVIENQLRSDNTLDVSATSDSGLTVSFTASGVCTVTGTEVEFTSFGDCTITADQAGDDTYAAAESVSQTFEIVSGSNEITFNSLIDLTYGDSYSVTGWYPENMFELDATADSGQDVVFAVEDTDICTIDADGTVGFFHRAGECVITATDDGGTYFDAALSVTQSFVIKRGDIDGYFFRAAGSGYSATIGDTVSVRDLFLHRTKSDYPAYARDHKPTYVIDASAGFYVPWLEGLEGTGLAECSGSDSDEDLSDASVTMSHGGTCIVSVRSKKNNYWNKAPQQTVDVQVNQRNQSIVINDYGISQNGERGGALTQTLSANQLRNFQIRADALYGSDAVDYSTQMSNCGVVHEDSTSGVFYSTAPANGSSRCRIAMELPETQDYYAATTRYITAQFSKAAPKIVFDKLSDMTFPGGSLGDGKENGSGQYQIKDRRFNIDAWVRALDGTELRQNSNWGGLNHRSRLVSLTPSVCDIIGDGVGDSTRKDNSMDRSTGIMLSTGKCKIQAFTDGGMSAKNAAPVTRTFMINAVPNAITFPAITSQGVGVELEMNVTATHYRVTLAESSAACELTGDKVAGYTLTMVAVGQCKVTATRGSTTFLAAAKTISRTFTVTKAAGTMTVGVDINDNGVFGGLGGGDNIGGNLGNDLGRAPYYNPTVNRSYDLGHVTNSAGTVTYSKVSGTCTVNSGAATVTITGRNNDGTCVVQAAAPATVDHTATSDTFTITVQKADATIGFFTNPGAVQIGTDVTLVATHPAGSADVTFTADGTECSIVAGKLRGLAAGTCTVSAQIPENSAFNASPSLSYDVSVSLASQTITFNPTSQRTYPSGSGSNLNKLTVTATSTSALTVAVTVVSGPCTVSSLTVTFTGVGSCILAANQAGNGTYAAATEVQRTIVVSKTPVAVTAPTVSVPLLKYGQTVTRTQGDWSGSGGSLSYATAWYRCTSTSSSTPTGSSVPSGCSLISGQTGATYLTTSSDLNKYIRVRITVTNYSGTSYRWSTTTGKLLAP